MYIVHSLFFKILIIFGTEPLFASISFDVFLLIFLKAY